MSAQDLERSWREAIQDRERRQGSIEVVELLDPVVYPPFVLPGSITAIVAESGDEVLAKVPELARSGDWRALSLELFDAEDTLLEGLESAGPDGLGSRPALAELHFGANVLVRGFGAPGGKAHAVLLTYAGALEGADFRLDVYARPEHGLDAVLIANPPELSEIERRIVAQVDQPEALVLAEPAFWPAAAKKAGGFVATYLTDKAVDKIVQAERDAAKRRERAQKLADRIGQENARRRYRNAELAPEKSALRRLAGDGVDVDPAQSTQELLAMRRQILKKALEDTGA